MGQRTHKTHPTRQLVLRVVLVVAGLSLLLGYITLHRGAANNAAQKQPEEEHTCSFSKWENTAVEAAEEDLPAGEFVCSAERFCKVELRHVRLERRGAKLQPDSPAHFQKLVVSGIDSELGVQGCQEKADSFSYIYEGCRRFGMNANLQFAQEVAVVGKGKSADGKPTILINCVDMKCHNYFHAMIYVAYPTFALMEQKGLQDLRGFVVRILAESSEGKSMLVTLVETLLPDLVVFSQLEEEENQDLGCFDQVMFVGFDTHPWHCNLDGQIGLNPTLLRMAKMIRTSLGFLNDPDLPTEVSILHAKRERKRKILNPEDVEAAFMRPFQTLGSSRTGSSWHDDFKRDLAQLREASILFGIHGAGLTNVMFMPRGSVLIEVLNDQFPFPAFRNMAIQSGHYYIPLEVSKSFNDSAVVLNEHLTYQHADLWVRALDVRRALDIAGQMLGLTTLIHDKD